MGDQGGQPDTVPLRTRRRFRMGRINARRAGALATSRTVGWMVAAALAGALVTLLLEPARSAPSPAVPFRNAGRAEAKPGRSAVAGSGHKVGVAVPAPGQVYPVPGRPGQVYAEPTPWQMYGQMYPAPRAAWLAGPPASVGMPGCVIKMPAQVPFAGPPPGRPGIHTRIGEFRPPKSIIMEGPGRRPTQTRIGRLPIVKRIIGIPGRCAVRIGIPGPCAVRVRAGRLMLPRRIEVTPPSHRPVRIRVERLRPRREVIVVGPGARSVIAMPGGAPIVWPPIRPGCVIVRPVQQP